jgi:hypothetical protein
MNYNPDVAARSGGSGGHFLGCGVRVVAALLCVAPGTGACHRSGPAVEPVQAAGIDATSAGSAGGLIEDDVVRMAEEDQRRAGELRVTPSATRRDRPVAPPRRPL